MNAEQFEAWLNDMRMQCPDKGPLCLVGMHIVEKRSQNEWVIHTAMSGTMAPAGMIQALENHVAFLKGQYEKPKGL